MVSSRRTNMPYKLTEEEEEKKRDDDNIKGVKKWTEEFQTNRQKAFKVIDELEKGMMIPDPPLKYGTAGFRTKAEYLD